MGKFVVIKCLVPMAVNIEDLQVHLSGKGTTVTVLTDSAGRSSDLRARIASRQVSVSVPGQSAARMWPFVPKVILPPLPSSPPSHPSPALLAVPDTASEHLRVLRSIDESLRVLVLRPSPPPAEVVAAHVHAISQSGVVPPGLPGAPHPQFIPSSILPPEADAGSDIKVKKGSGADVDGSVSALRDLRRRQ